MSDVLRRWFMRLRYEHRRVGLVTLNAEIEFCERWIAKARMHVETRQYEVERMRRDLQASDSLTSIARRAQR